MTSDRCDRVPSLSNPPIRMKPSFSPLMLSLTLAIVGATTLAPAQAQTPSNAATANDPSLTIDHSNLLSLTKAQTLLNEAKAANDRKDYATALDRLQLARRIFNQLSNFHFQLAQRYDGINNLIFDEQRRQTITTGQLRDETTQALAQVYLNQNKPELAVSLLVQVIQSQSPASPLGKQAYKQLWDLGFVTMGYPKEEAAQWTVPPSQPLKQDSNFSISGGQALLKQVNQAIDQQNYDLAIQQLKTVRILFDQLSTLYGNLASSFEGIETNIYNQEREQAVLAANLRDEATYQLALVHRSRQQPELSIPLLIQIIQVQEPNAPLAQKAYGQLQAIGFAGSTQP